MNIDLRNFVDINIQERVSPILTGIRDTVALFTDYGTRDKTYPSYDNDEIMTNVIVNLNDAHNKYYTSSGVSWTPKVGAENLCKYIETYFNNGGCKLAIYEGVSSDSTDDLISLIETLIRALPDEQICVASTNANYEVLKSVAISINSDNKVYGIKEKMIFARTESVNDATEIKNFVAKYSTSVGVEMTMLAYLSRIDTHKTDTVYDYAFTQEKLNAENISNDQFETLMNNNINVDINLANNVRVCGGNCKDGIEMTNNYVRIVLHQTLTNKLIQVLTGKIKSTMGLAKLYTAITQEMSYYLNCGYLTTDKIWSDETLSIERNGRSYTIIEKGTPLVDGYIVKILPLASLTEEDKQKHVAPLIYMIIADQYSIRKITLNGEII